MTNDTRGRILIIDDDRDFSEAVATFLRTHGYDVEQAPNGEKGLESAHRAIPDLVLMDVMMGERTEGLFTVQRFRRDPVLQGVPVFVVTSLYSDVPGFRVQPDKEWTGHSEFFPKPLDLDRLLDAVERHLSDRTGAPGGEGASAP